jgi:tRNA modification GTPase
MPPSDDDIRVALLTPPGRGALAVIGIVGPRAVDLADAVFQPRSGLPIAGRHDAAVCLGRWPSTSSSVGEDVVVVRHGPAHVEVHCHGGLAASAAVLRSLVAQGAAAVPWADLQAALGADEISLEARRAVPLAAGPKAARILVRQLAGALVREIATLDAMATGGMGCDLGERIGRLLRAARVGLRLTSPWRVVFTGRVNAGKSSLINALAGHGRMLVSPRAGTTRDLVETRVVLGGWEIDLVDTAGMRDAAAAVGPVERAGIERARTAAAEADLVVDVVAADIGQAYTQDRQAVSPRRLRVVSKADLVDGVALPDPGVLCTSARTGIGIDRLAMRIADLLVPEEAAEPGLLDGAVPFTPRQVDLLRRLLPPHPLPSDRGPAA